MDCFKCTKINIFNQCQYTVQWTSRYAHLNYARLQVTRANINNKSLTSGHKTTSGHELKSSQEMIRHTNSSK